MVLEMNDFKCVIKVVLDEGAQLPTKGRSNDVGYDLTVHSVETSDRGLSSVNIFLVDFGVRIQPPSGFYCELLPRSSLAWSGFIMPNSVGVIDPDYRGNLKMPLMFMGKVEEAKDLAQKLVGRRIAQLVLRRIQMCEFLEVKSDELTLTTRGELGFGSSGQ